MFAAKAKVYPLSPHKTIFGSGIKGGRTENKTA